MALPTLNHESLSVVKMLIKLFAQFGISKTFSTDHGPDFTSESTKHLSNLFRSERLPAFAIAKPVDD